MLCFIIAASYILTGCSGCSDSSLRYRMMEQDQVERSHSTVPQARPNPITQSPATAESNPNRISQTNLNLTLEDLFELRKEAVFVVDTRDSEYSYQGSGFFIDNRGLAVSNYHVFEGTRIRNARIRTFNNSTYQIENVIEP